VKTAVAQIACSLGDVAANVSKLVTFSDRAKAAGAELIVFPEMSDTGYAMDVIREQARPWSEGAVPQLRETARQLKLAIICGVSEREADCVYNTQVFIDAAGEVRARYRKSHLFTPAPIEEHTCFACGDELVTCDAPGLGIRLGFSICYDLRFPEVYRQLARVKQANAFAISSAWPFPRVEHLRVLATARAIENQSYVLLANRVGTDAAVTFCGTSAIIDPYGVVVAAASTDREELLLGEVSAESIQQVRTRMPVLDHCRDELYR
jgi:omega-amidase